MIPSGSAIALFCLASIALAVVPGPAVTYIVTQSIDKGRSAGLFSALGVASGGLVHVAAATVGLSALIASSATAFTTVKLVGAVYLVVVGIRRILSRDEDAEVLIEPTPHRRLYLQGVVVNVFNPKTALFFLAFLPQFVSRSDGPVWSQTLVFGLLYIALGLLSDSTYAFIGARAGGWLRRRTAVRRRGRYIEGGVLIGLGITALAAPHQQPAR